MQKFKFIVIDDQGVAVGWGRVFENFLRSNRYVENREATPNDDDSNSMNYKILNWETNFNYDSAFEYLKNNQDEYDFYFIDLKMDNHNFAPREDDLYDAYLGGLKFVNVLKKNRKPKIIFSGATETVGLIQHYKLIENRIDDIIFGRIEQDSYMKEIEEKIDNYLRSRQIEIISPLPLSFLKKLRRRLENNEDWDIDDIPDNKKENKSENWSLQTLFPKQANKIMEINEYDMDDIDEEADETIAEKKNYIRDILDSDWRKLMKTGFLNHPSQKYCRFKDPMKNVETMDFGVLNKTRHYKKLTAFSAFKDCGELDNLRDNIFHGVTVETPGGSEDYKIAYLPHLDNPISVIDYFLKILKGKEIDRPINECLRGWCVDYGIYPIDVAYISNIVFHNKRHIDKDAEIDFDFFDDEENETINFTWSYSKASYSDNEIYQKIIGMYSKFIAANKNLKVLEDSGMSDICKIVCFRYRGEVKFEFGHYKLRAVHDPETFLTDEEENAELKNLEGFVKIFLVKSDEYINGPRLSVFIS